MSTGQNMHAGVDFGSRMAGTTAIAWVEEGKLEVRISAKKQDADRFLEDYLTRLSPELVCIDAPLSLPAAYGGSGEDFMFRHADRELGAMSPLFLGGLTARAMRLQHRQPRISFLESYPAQVVRIMKLDTCYKEDLGCFLGQLQEILPFSINQAPSTWHEADALLAWYTGWRYKQGLAQSWGDPSEGLIWA